MPNISNRTRSLAACIVVVALAATVTSCGNGPGDDGAAGDDRLTGTITVADAASLTDAYDEIAKDFEKAHPGVTVTLNPDSSATLVEQILAGAPADVFASADGVNMAKLAKAKKLREAPSVFARNRLVIVTKPANPTGIEGLADLPDAGVISLCGKEAPCGRYAGEILDRAKVEVRESEVTRGQNVKATLTAVTDGDAVAGIVYVTDAAAAGKAVETVQIPAADNAQATYPIAVLRGARQPKLATAFVAYVLSDKGQATLAKYGFLAPK